MFKFLRKILVLGIVFSLSIPSFAAVSVSDGSAFVSKAEFSASLNNLSSRMSNLENSLDAKIDSLVSSYLSRNGIWNGEAQTIKLSNSSGTEVRYYSLMDSVDSTNGYKRGSINKVGTSRIVIPKISKSGLLFMDIKLGSGDWENTGIEVLNTRLVFKNTKSSTGVNRMCMTITYLLIGNNDSQSSLSGFLNNGYVSLLPYQMPFYMYANISNFAGSYPPNIATISGFVNKNDTIYATTFWTYYLNGGDWGYPSDLNNAALYFRNAFVY